MKTSTLVFLLIIAIPGFSQVDTINVSSKITNVTVFLSGAEITRELNLNVGEGKHVLVVDQLPLEINPQSIQVTSLNNVKIQSVKHELHYPGMDRNKAERDGIEQQIEEQKYRLQSIQNRREVFDIEEQLLMDNSQFGKKDGGLAISELQEVADFYRSRINAVREAQLELHKEKEQIEKDIQKLNQKINRLNPTQHTALSKILIGISNSQAIAGKMQMSYYIPSAAWTPLYDFRVETTDDPLTIVYNAHVYQSSGEDWKNVNLKLSTGNPSLSGTLPTLQSWYLDRKSSPPSTEVASGTGSLQGRVMDVESDEPLPFVNVVLKQGDQQINGAASTIDGHYNIKPIESGIYDLDVGAVGYEKLRIEGVQMRPNRITFQDIFLSPARVQMEEFEVISYRVPLIDRDGGSSGSTITRDDISRSPGRSASIVAGTVRGSRSDSKHYVDGITVRGSEQLPLNMQAEVIDTKIQNLEYEIELPHTIPSDGQDHLIKIKEEQPAVRYLYHAIPKLDSDVFLMAELIDWAELNLLSGQSSIYYGGTFTGESYLDTKHMGDTLSLSLAQEPNILVERILDKDLNDRRIIGNSVRETFAWEIKIKNNLGKPINIIISDQFPLSDRRSIEVDILENSGAEVDNQTGKLTWENEIATGEQLTLNHGYSIKYPSGTRIYRD